MPIYEYRCQQCDHVQEQFHRSLDNAKVPDCETCEGGLMQRVISRFATPQDRVAGVGTVRQPGSRRRAGTPTAIRARSAAGPRSALIRWASRCPPKPSR